MNSDIIKKTLLCVAFLSSTMAFSQSKVVGGATMKPTNTIVQNTLRSSDHTTLVKALKTANLVKTLNGNGPFTVFAPTNNAFNKLTEKKLTQLMETQNKTALQNILKYHVVSGKVSAKNLKNAIDSNDGKYSFKTLNGKTLTAIMRDRSLVIKDQSGSLARITIADVNQSNGMIHVVDTVLMPQ